MLGRGGMGRVLEVRDAVLGRGVAMKVARADLSPAALSRFVAEAQATSQLEHPGIVPIYDLGMLPSSEPYYTMPLIRGQTLSTLIRGVHGRSGPDRWMPSAAGVSFHRLISIFHAVCEAMAYAHARGVIHRDLKPDNVMVGPFGVTLVVDWGLARVLGHPEAVAPVETTRTRETNGTLDGAIVGTPGYLAPEQARGDLDDVDARADVHALGATLYEIFVGHPPFHGESRFDAIVGVLHDRAKPITGAPGPLPEELVQLAMDCLEKDPAQRPADAGVVARVVGDWLDGARRRERAEAELAEAERLQQEIDALRAEAAALATRADAARRALPRWAPEGPKRGVWRLEDRAAATRSRADLLEARRLEALQAALRYVPDLAAPHALLAEHYQRRHARAELERRADDAAALELLLRTHDRGRYGTYLEGRGAVSLVTDPPGADVAVFRYEVQDRRMVAVPFGRLGPTPLREVELPLGSYRLVVSHPDRARVVYPVVVRRGGHWDGTRPLPLPAPGELGEHDLYVPAGPFITGGDPEAFFPHPRAEHWLDGFVLRRFPVTNGEYLLFLNALIDAGREEDAVEWAPREQGASEPILRREGGRFVLGIDRDGDVWLPDSPVVCVSWGCARAYAAWESERTGLAWRLPWELEWEKAARGVDERTWPWGSFADPAWANVRDHAESPGLASIRACPQDVGPYGHRGLVGNVTDWCLDVFGDVPTLPGTIDPGRSDTPRPLRGSDWTGGLRAARCASRGTVWQRSREAQIGFRLARSI